MADRDLLILESKDGTSAEGFPIADIEGLEYTETDRGGILRRHLKVWIKNRGVHEFTHDSAEQVYEALKSNAEVVKLT